MTTAKNEFIGLKENCNSMGRELTLGGGSLLEGIFQGGRWGDE